MSLLREVPRLTGNPALIQLSKFLDEMRDILLNLAQNNTINTAVYDVHIASTSKHRTINDTGTSTTDLFSASKINSLFDDGIEETILITGVSGVLHTLTFNTQGLLTNYTAV